MVACHSMRCTCFSMAKLKVFLLRMLSCFILVTSVVQLAEELGYAVETRKPGTSEWQEHISEVAASTGLSGRQVRMQQYIEMQGPGRA